MTRSLWLAWTLPLFALAASAQKTFKQYEDDYVARKMAENRCRREPEPEGKRVEAIVVETADIFDPGDLAELKRIPILGIAPRYANWLHATTRKYIVEREVLFQVGEPFRTALADETERNLRAIVIFNIARVVPCRGSKPDSVKVLVVTKDLWSLRLESDFQVAAGRLDFFRLAVIERNVAGRYKQLSALLGITRDTVSVGQAFLEPRVLGSRVAIEESATLIFGPGGRGIEGGTAALSVGQPLYSLASTWGFDVTATYETRIHRFFRGDDLFRCFSPRGTVDVVCDSAIVSAEERMARLRAQDHVSPVYRSQIFTLSAGATRRFGDLVKHDLSWGYGLRHRRFDLLGLFPSDGFRDAVTREFLPLPEDAGFVFAGYRTFEASYRRLRNVNRYATTEDFQIGHNAQVAVRWANKLFGFANTFVELEGRGQYRWAFGENLLTVFASVTSRGEPTAFVNNRFLVQVNNVSPVLGLGRLFVDATATFRFDDRDNVRSRLGGNAGLRGFDTDEFAGRHAINLHVEYRSLPIDLFTIQLGFVGFYDAGHAADELSALRLQHSLGVGMRIFIPQINRMVLRVDLGFPLDGRKFDLARQLSFSFDQAF